MSTELIINASLPETRIVLQENGEIQELLIERASGKGIVGNIYKGRVTRVLPGMQAAFVDIGLDKAAFLYVDDVYNHPEIFDEEGGGAVSETDAEAVAETEAGVVAEAEANAEAELDSEAEIESESDADTEFEEEYDTESESDSETESDSDSDPDQGGTPVAMGPAPEGGGEEGNDNGGEGSEGGGAGDEAPPSGTVSEISETDRPRGRRGRRGGRFRGRRRPQGQGNPSAGSGVAEANDAPGSLPDPFLSQVADAGDLESDRSAITHTEEGVVAAPKRPPSEEMERKGINSSGDRVGARREFREPRGRDRRIRNKTSTRSFRGQVNIQDLLKEGQEVIVQVAKDPIAAKGARLTCHISLPGRHLVCMPTIDHVGVSRRIERDDERRKLREYVERRRPRKMGFIVRTASSGKSPETAIAQDVDYLATLWNEIREKAMSVSAPSLVYEDLNPMLRAIRDWVNEDIDKIIVDSRYHHTEIKQFVSRFMPQLEPKVELYHGDIPIFDAYGISTELHRSLERKVWLKSGGYIVIDQAEALVAIDVNTGRYVGKRNLEDTILKTNLEAVQEVAYQLRLRNCGGIIIIDLIDMEKDENRTRVYRALEDALKKDRSRPTILKISELGLVEMTRKRTRDTVVRALCEPCQHCEGKGFVKSRQTVAYEVLREIEREGNDRESKKILIQAHPDVVDILAIDEREILESLERRYRKHIFLQAVTDFHPEQYEVVGEKSHQKQPYVPRAAQRDSNDRFARRKERDRGGRDRDRQESRDRGDRERSDREAPPRFEGPRPSVWFTGNGPSAQAAANGNSTAEVSTPSETSTGEQPLSVVVTPRAVPMDEDSIGNRAVDPNAPQSEADPVQAGQASGPSDDFDEEDRLAFLRAQAAQDAALSNFGANGNSAGNGGQGFRNHRPNSGAGGGGGGGGRGGKRRGGRRNRGFRGGGAQGPGRHSQQRWNDGRGNES